MLKIALLGYGKMGRRIHELAERFDVEVALRVDPSADDAVPEIQPEQLALCDVAIDFSHPEATPGHLQSLLNLSVPAVIGTTGWFESLETVKKQVQQEKGKILYGSNFSLGVQLFNKLVARAGELFGPSEQFDAGLHELHHTEKADAPSGTGRTLTETWLAHAGSGKKPHYGIPEKGKPDSDQFYVTSQRIGSIFGEHHLKIISEFDDIEISHKARSRDGFAAGALRAALWLHQQKQGFFLIEDVIEEIV